MRLLLTLLELELQYRAGKVVWRCRPTDRAQGRENRLQYIRLIAAKAEFHQNTVRSIFIPIRHHVAWLVQRGKIPTHYKLRLPTFHLLVVLARVSVLIVMLWYSQVVSYNNS
jgi:hypothetical protein